MTQADSTETHRILRSSSHDQDHRGTRMRLPAASSRTRLSFQKQDKVKAPPGKAETMTGETIGAAVVQLSTPKSNIKGDDQGDEANTDSCCGIVDR